MVLGRTDANRLLLLADELLVEQEDDMNLFFITNHHLFNVSHPKQGVNMDIKFKRKIMSEMMTTYLPSLLLMMITFATTFFKPFFFEAALSVNLTTMLVMTTIFISKMEGLPPTSAIKMIDFWLILCQLVPFVEVVLLTAMEFFRDKEEQMELPVTKEDEPKQAQPEGNMQLDIDADNGPKEAWIGEKSKPPRRNLVPILAAIGKLS